MLRRRLAGVALAAAVLLFAAPRVQATDGHFLHGVGAVNSAMGGAGTAAHVSVLGTFFLNPAGLLAYEGTRVEFSFEMFKPDRTVSSNMPGIGSGSTRSKSEFTPIPALGFAIRVNDRLSLGLGGIGIAGFGVDYPQNNANPINGPRPFGFGQIYSNYSLLKFTPAIAYAITEDFWIGGAANVSWATLSIDPAPFAPPAVTFGQDGNPGTLDDEAFYSRATATDGAFGFGFQVGLQWQATDRFALGAAYSSPQWFDEFKWNATWENPNITTPSQFGGVFGTDRTLTFSMDVPGFVTGGLAWEPMDGLLLAGDVRYFFYENTKGFKLPEENKENPFTQTGAVAGFGWKNILSIHGGVQFAPIDAITLRAGYNYADNPVPDKFSFFNTPAPAIVQHHATLGLSLHLSNSFAIDLGYYHVFENSGTGTFWTPMGPMDGTSVTNKMFENSLSIGFTFNTK